MLSAGFTASSNDNFSQLAGRFPGTSPHELLAQASIELANLQCEERLLDAVLDHALALSGASGGVLYLMRADTGDGSVPNQSPLPGPCGNLDVRRQDMQEPLETDGLQEALRTRQAVFVGAQTGRSGAGHDRDVRLFIPLMVCCETAVGGLELVFETHNGFGLEPCSTALLEAWGAISAMAIDGRAMRKAVDEMAESVADMAEIALAEKSPHVQTHCSRVTELAVMLAEAVDDTSAGAFADFRFANQQEWQEFTLAARLHDCGKLGTPTHLLDKGTKLETVTNRIHEVRTRFEVLRRDATIECLTGRLEALGGCSDPDEDLLSVYRTLDEEFRFLADCNIGGESLNNAARDRVRQIGSRQWTRHFDDRIGLSAEESYNLRQAQNRFASCTATLLNDCLEEEQVDQTVLRPQFGEAYNLTVTRGTLGKEERAQIERHSVTTVEMLQAIAFPPHLRRVAGFAGAHHETLDGSGYPFGLQGDEIPVAARIIALADKFEALTSSDRPYKTAHSLEEALKILVRFCESSAVDADLFQVFLESGVYRRFAELHLKDTTEVEIGPLVAAASRISRIRAALAAE